ncbi:hypothetical protein Tco_0876451 [Tanacetum coccineum]|uniref:Uncharacterized protein n=1 Tax=Tanacetum coccineum TaxID=301880 RepID=A0ABQ5BSA0_9ASTR
MGWQRGGAWLVASGGVESRVRGSDGGDRIDREMGRIFGVGRKSSPENFSGGCGLCVRVFSPVLASGVDGVLL